MKKEAPNFLDISQKDSLFQSEVMSSFKFDASVAAVFDDMVSRSVPIYAEVHQIILDLIGRRSFKADDKIVDIGCSTATTLFILHHYFKREGRAIPTLIGLDPSEEMLAKAREKAAQYSNVDIELRHQGAADYHEASVDVVIMNYTLQFIPLGERPQVLAQIYDSLKPGGLFILAEKIMSPVTVIQEAITDLYYDFKRRGGYNELEISRKREALENVLVPLSGPAQIKMLESAGFEQSEMIFRWYNFACYLGVK